MENAKLRQEVKAFQEARDSLSRLILVKRDSERYSDFLADYPPGQTWASG